MSKYGDKDLFYLIDNGDISIIAYSALEEGHKEITHLMIEGFGSKKVNNYSQIAKIAARKGYLDVVKNMIALGAMKWGAGDNQEILSFIIECENRF